MTRPPQASRPLHAIAGLVMLAVVPAVARAETAEEAAASLVEDLLERAVVHGLDSAWIDAHVAVPPSGAARDRWVRLLRPFGPTDLVLGACHGSSAVVEGPDYVRVVLECRPPLSVVVRQVDGHPRIAAIEPTMCAQCDERSRFVIDLIADVRRDGELGEHLRPDFELVPADRKDAGSKWETWSALAEARYRADLDIAAAIGNAEVVGVEGEVVRVRLADGAEDTWHVVTTPRGWAIVYDDLAGSSPLRLSTLESRRWKRASVRQEAAVQTWTPVWRPLDGGAATLIGHHALAATFDAADETIVAVLMDREVPFAAVVEIDPATSTILRRWSIALPDGQDPVHLEDGVPPERVAFDPSTRKVALAAFGRIWVVDRNQDTVKELTRAKRVTALDWSRATGGFVWGTQGGALQPVPSSWHGTPTIPGPVALDVSAHELAVITAEGFVARWTPPPPERDDEPTRAKESPTPRPRDADKAAEAEEKADPTDEAGAGDDKPAREADGDPPGDVEPPATTEDVEGAPDAGAEEASGEGPPADAARGDDGATEAPAITVPASEPRTPQIAEPIRTAACPRSIVGAARSPVSGGWLVACGASDRQSFATVRMPGVLVEPVGDIGGPSPAVAWSTSTPFIAVPAPPEAEASMVIWELTRRVPWTVIGRQTAVSAAFSPDGSQLVTTDVDGALVLWDLALAHRRYPVPDVLAPPSR